MLVVWTLFSIITAIILSKANHRPLQKETPKFVYGWFFLVYRVCYGLAIFGYVLFMIELLGFTHFLIHTFNIEFSSAYVGILFIFYGLYFGVLGRDFAEMCTDRMASVMGFTGKGNIPSKSVPSGICCICGDHYDPNESIELTCKHKFHERCLRGWTIIGKKDTCPYCSEKVRLKDLFHHPWEQPGIVWAQLMDALRYMIVWNPIIMTAVNLFLYYVDPGA